MTGQIPVVPPVVQQAYDAYMHQQRQVTLSLANRGFIVDELHDKLMSALEASPVETGWLEHELARTHDWIARQRAETKKLRRAWVQARIDAGEDVNAKLRQDVGL